MQAHITIVVLSSIFVGSIQMAPTESVDCSKLDEVVDDLSAAQAWSFANDKYKIPTSAEGFAKSCLQSSDALKTLRKYNKQCNSALTQQVFSAVLRTRTKMMESVCKADTPENHAAVEASKCASKNGQIFKEIETKLIADLYAVLESTISDDKERLYRACCLVNGSERKFLDVGKEKCREQQKVFADYMDSYTAEAMALVCPQGKELDCDKYAPLKSDPSTKRSLFYLLPLMKLVKSLDH